MRMKQKLLSILALLLVTATGAWAEDIEIDGGSRTISSDVSSDYFYMYEGTLTIEKGATVTLSSSFYFDEGSNIYLHGTLQGGVGVGGVWSDGCVIHIYLNDGAKYTLSGVTAPSDACQIYYGYDAATDGNGTVSVKNGAVEVTSSSTGYKSATYTFTASPNSGYKFKNWTKGAGGEVLGTDASINVTCEQNGQYQVYANFEEDAQDPTYIVAGNKAEIFGNTWDGFYGANKMTKGGDGKYTKTYNVEDAIEDIQLKVVKDGQDWFGDETGNNVTFSMKQAGSFTVTIDPNANPVYATVTGANVVFANTEYAINYATGMQNGIVTGPDTAKEDDEVTFTITPAAGYVLESISVTGVTTENAVEVTDGKFTMPAEDVNVIATFKLVTYAITLAEGTEDADKWTISPNPAEAGSPVTATYSGDKKVKSVKAVKVAPAPTDLATITANYEAKDGETLTGTLGSNVKISIADGAKVTLKDVTINGVDDWSYVWAGITCEGDATITLEGTNTVKGFHAIYPGIYVPENKTLTIQGNGTLNASSNGNGAGIGGGHELPCGNIVINSGNITATGGAQAAGIGGGYKNGSCGNISISGGTVAATGGDTAAGIGSGNRGTCGAITISGGTVTATGGSSLHGGAGIGSGQDGSCGDISISGGTVEATGGTDAAGIGGGYKNGSCGTITIKSTVTSVTATKGSGAPNSIGAGRKSIDITVNIEDGANVTQN